MNKQKINPKNGSKYDLDSAGRMADRDACFNLLPKMRDFKPVKLIH